MHYAENLFESECEHLLNLKSIYCSIKSILNTYSRRGHAIDATLFYILNILYNYHTLKQYMYLYTSITNTIDSA